MIIISFYCLFCILSDAACLFQFHFSLFLLIAYHLIGFSSIFCSYCGAQIFEIYGIGKDIVDFAFRGSVSKIGGLTLDEVRKRSIKHLSFLVGNIVIYLYLNHHGRA